MSGFMDGDDFPGRPEHPDFWKIAEIILQLDGRAEDDPINVLSREADTVADSSCVSYIAVQRGLRLGVLLGLESKSTRSAEVIGGLAAMWAEAFIVGARFQERNR